MPKKNFSVRTKVSVKKSTGNQSRRPLLIFAVLAVVFAGIGYYFFVGGNSLSLPFLKPAPPKVLSLDTKKARHVMVDEKGATLHMYDSHKVLVSFYVPPNAVAKKQFFTLTPIKGDNKTQTGVKISPENYTFAKPVSMTFDFTKSDLKNDAPDTVQTKSLRATGSSHVYAYDTTGKTLTPILVSRAMESATYLSARSKQAGTFYVRLKDSDQIYYAHRSLANNNAGDFTLLESAATVLYNNQSLSTDEKNRVTSALTQVKDDKTSTLFSLYAALAVEKKLTNKTSFIPKAYAWDTSLFSEQLRSTCKETNHSLETYIVSALLADMNGMSDIGDVCRGTLTSVLPKRVAALVADPKATFDQVVTMLAQVSAIEGPNGADVMKLSDKLQTVVNADVTHFVNFGGNGSVSEQVTAEMDFTSVDPAVRAKLESVKAADANRQLEQLLAQNCQTKNDLEWARVVATQYRLDQYLQKINTLLEHAAKSCDDPIGKPEGKTVPPPVKIGDNPAKQQPAGRCLDVNDYQISADGDTYSCKTCYDVMTNDSAYKVLYSDCEVGTGYDYCQAMDDGLQKQACDYSDVSKPGPYFNPNDTPGDPPLADPNTGDNVTNDNSSNQSDPPLADPQTGDSVPNNDSGN